MSCEEAWMRETVWRRHHGSWKAGENRGPESGFEQPRVIATLRVPWQGFAAPNSFSSHVSNYA